MTRNAPFFAILPPEWMPDVQAFFLRSGHLYSGDCRLDAGAYAESAARVLDMLATSGPTERLDAVCGTVWHPVQTQARSNFKRIYTDAIHGVPFVSSRSMFFFPFRAEKFLSTRIPKIRDLMVPAGWLLLSRSGTVGNVLYVSPRLARYAFTDHAIRIEPKTVPPGYLYAFLSSQFGKVLIAKGIYGGTVAELEPGHIGPFPVPRIGEQAETEIHKAIVSAYAMRDAASALIEEAEAELRTVVGVEPFDTADIEYLGNATEPRAFAVGSGALNDRLDATSHTPVVRSVVHKLQGGRFPLARIGDRVDRVYVAPRFARIYVDQAFGVPLLQGRQLPMMRVTDLKFISKTQTAHLDRWIIHAGWVLVTCSGTLGRVAVSTPMQDGWAASQHILRIVPRPKVSDAGFLAAFLAQSFGQYQLQAKSYGGVVSELTEDDTAAILMPDVPYELQCRIGAKVVDAYAMRDLATGLETAAIADFEQRVGGTQARVVYRGPG